jgi:hypothetical protein
MAGHWAGEAEAPQAVSESPVLGTALRALLHAPFRSKRPGEAAEKLRQMAEEEPGSHAYSEAHSRSEQGGPGGHA